MTDWKNDQHLSHIETIRHLMDEAKGADTQAVGARQQLVLLYYGAAYRYILGCLRDPEAAQDLAQQFAIRLMQGDYIKSANPDKGRFRDYLKRSLQNAVTDHLRKGKGPMTLPEDSGAFARSKDEDESPQSDRVFLESVREELVSCTWKSLGQYQQETSTPYESVLRIKTEHPQLRSQQIAQQLSQQQGKTYSESGVRQILHRAREKFGELLVDNVERALQTSDREALEELLVDLKLLEFCKPALAKRFT
jgi:RNA polymerase sigma-70 factor (ECF subfamily)